MSSCRILMSRTVSKVFCKKSDRIPPIIKTENEGS